MPEPNTCSTPSRGESAVREADLTRRERDGVSRVSLKTPGRAVSSPVSHRQVGELITHAFTRGAQVRHPGTGLQNLTRHRGQ